MIIDFNCNTHGSTKLQLSQKQAYFLESRKDFPDVIEDYIKDELKCSICSKGKEIEASKLGSGIPVRFKDCSFDNFRQCKEKKSVQDYAKNFSEVMKFGRCLILSGNVGTGKTHLISALLNHLIDHYQSKVLYTKAFDLLRGIKETYNKKNTTTFSDTQKKFTRVDLLVIDEIGVQFGTDTEKDILFEIINDRYENFKPTILITNLAIAKLKEYVGDRVIDRMRENEGKMIIFEGESFRGKK